MLKIKFKQVLIKKERKKESKIGNYEWLDNQAKLLLAIGTYNRYFAFNGPFRSNDKTPSFDNNNTTQKFINQ